MTQPVPATPLPIPAQATLRPIEHPDMSALLTHFCHRARPQSMVPPQITSLTVQQRLESILWEGQLRAFVTYSGGDPAVCMTEATVPGLQFLMSRRAYQPWGLVLDRQSVYDVGGGPVWYTRPNEYWAVRDVSNRVRTWAVRLEAGSSDFLEEREWRVPVDPTPPIPNVPLTVLRIAAVLVGDAQWTPTRLIVRPSPATGVPEYGPAVPGVLCGVPRWWWSAAGQQLYQLPPLA